MKEIKFECPHCAQRLDVPEEYLGETIACPTCHGAIQFPESLPAAQNILDNVPPPTPERETKHCPYCAEEILEQARKCKHCGEILDHALRAERESVTPQSVQRNDHSPNTSPSVEKTEYEVHPAMFRNHPIAFLLCIVIPILGWLILFAWWIECLAIRLTITNKRTTLRKGIISKHTNEVRHSDVRNVQVGQGILQRLFGVGRIGIASAGQGTVEIIVAGIPNPSEVKRIIDTYRDQRCDRLVFGDQQIQLAIIEM